MPEQFALSKSRISRVYLNQASVDEASPPNAWGLLTTHA